MCLEEDDGKLILTIEAGGTSAAVSVDYESHLTLGDVLGLVPGLLCAFGYIPGSFVSGGMDHINDWVSTLEPKEDK